MTNTTPSTPPVQEPAGAVEALLKLADAYAEHASWAGYYSDDSQYKNESIDKRDTARAALAAALASLQPVTQVKSESEAVATKKRPPLMKRRGFAAEAQGVFRKFKVTRTDGSSAKGGKHHDCEYFVLDVDHDPYAKAALTAYATVCEGTHKLLALDMRLRYDLPDAAPQEAVERQPPMGWISVDERLPPEGEIVLTLSKRKRAVNGVAYGLDSWSESDNYAPSAKMFKRDNTHWAAMPPLPEPIGIGPATQEKPE